MIFTVSYCNKYRLVSPPHVFIESFNPRVSRRTIKMFALLPNPSLTVPPTRSAKRTSTESDQGPKASRVFEVHNWSLMIGCQAFFSRSTLQSTLHYITIYYSSRVEFCMRTSSTARIVILGLDNRTRNISRCFQQQGWQFRFVWSTIRDRLVDVA